MAEIVRTEIDDKDLFGHATAPPEPAAPPPEAAPTEPIPATETPPPAPVSEELVPSWRLREETQTRQAVEERLRMLEARHNEVMAHLQQQQPQKKPDFFENPDQATQAIMARYLQPYVEETRRTLMHLGKMTASSLHGAEKVDEAEQAFLQAMNNQSLSTAEYEGVVQSPNRYDAVVHWHRQKSAFNTVGTDPAAWFQKQLDEKMADPKFQAALLEKM